MYKYVFFDLDGTITEPEEGIINGVLYALSKFEITVEDPDNIVSVYWTSTPGFVSGIS